MLPHVMEVKVTSIDRLTDYEQPLKVNYDVSGTPGSPTGKRLVLPSDLFESNSKSTFPHEKRESAVYFEYPYTVQDALRINLPPTFSIESMPQSDSESCAKQILYKISTEQRPNTYTVRRDFILGGIVFMPNVYPDLRSFYNKLETRDGESLVLKVADADTVKTRRRRQRPPLVPDQAPLATVAICPPGTGELTFRNAKVEFSPPHDAS